MLDASALQRFNVFVATPCYGGSLFYTYVVSIIRLIAAARNSGLSVDFHFRAGDSLVTRARNDCVAEFLTHKHFTHLLWIDGDIGFSPEAVFRLLLADRDVAAGVYPLKRDDWPAAGLPAGMTRAGYEAHFARYPVNAGGLTSPGEVRLKIDDDGFMKVHDAPTGFMLIKRGVFDRLIAAYPDYKYTPDWPEGTYPTGGVHYRFFDTMVDPETRRFLSEDYAFCRLLQQLGVDIYVDANSNLTHLGTKSYTGDFGTSLKTSPTGAIGAVKGARIVVEGVDRLKPNP